VRTRKSLPLVAVASLGLVVLASVSVGGCCTDVCALKPGAQGVTAGEAYDLIQANEGDANFVILDVRTQAEYDSGHIEGAINLDVTSDTFSDDVGNLDRNNTYLVYCAAGARSGQAADIMNRGCFGHLYDMTGGITAWIAADFPVTEAVQTQ